MEKAQSVALNISKTISYGLFGIIITYLFLVSIFSTCVMSYMDEHIFYVKDFGILMVFGIGCLLVLCALLRGKFSKIPCKAYYLITFLWFALLLALIFITDFRPQYDPGSVYDAAGCLLRGDYTPWQRGEYLYTFPFQNGLVLLEVTFWLLLGEKAYLGIQVYNLILWYATIHGLCYLTKQYFGKNVAKIGYVLLLAFVPMWAYVTYCYGTVPGLAFSVFAMCFENRYEQNGKWKELLFCGLCLFVAIMYKSNYEVFAIAIGIMLLLHSIKKATWKPLVGIVVIIAAVLLEIKLIPYILHLITGADTGNGIPMIAWIAMGLKESNIAPGWYNRFTVLAYEECGYDIAAVTERSVASIKETLSLFGENTAYAISFFGRKIASMWSSPELECFTTINKMNVGGTLPYWMKDILYNGGLLNTGLLLLLDVFQSVTYALVLLYLLLSGKKIKIEQGVLLITFLGGFIFHLFWEGKCQYSIPYYVLLLPYAAKGLEDATHRLQKWLQKLFSKEADKKTVITQACKTVSGKAIGIFLVITLVCTVLNGSFLQSTVKLQSDTGEWIYFMQNSTQWKNEDFDTSDTSYG